VIRHAVRDLLDGKTAADDKVTAMRFNPYRLSDLPAISVYTIEETVDIENSTAPKELARELQLEIQGWVKADEDVTADDAMDALALEIETAMHADPYLGGAASDSVLIGTTTGMHNEGDRLMGILTLTYAVTYHTLAPETSEGLDDFLVAAVTTNLGGEVQEDEAAQDEVVVQELPDES